MGFTRCGEGLEGHGIIIGVVYIYGVSPILPIFLEHFRHIIVLP